jgi:molybdopterin-guanine dinucleotide biosynthesis protein A
MTLSKAASFDAIVIAGGKSSRLGVDKALVEVEGVRLLDRVLLAVRDAAEIAVVGPHRPAAADVQWCRERPPGGGPVAALAAGLAATRADVVVVLAVDLPFIAAAVPRLLAVRADTDAPVVALVDDTGQVNYLAAAWRRDALISALGSVGPVEGAPMRRLYADAAVVPLLDAGNWGADCDTMADIDDARARAANGAV